MAAANNSIVLCKYATATTVAVLLTLVFPLTGTGTAIKLSHGTKTEIAQKGKNCDGNRLIQNRRVIGSEIRSR